MEKIITVDEEDNIKESKERGTLTNKEIYRVSALWIENSKGETLLARRAWTKRKDPGMWGPAVAGTVEENETYESNIIKETKEELGIKDIKIEEGPKIRSISPHNHFTQWFIFRIDLNPSDLNINKEEVDEIKWFEKKELLELMKNKPEKFVKSMRKFIENTKIIS